MDVVSHPVEATMPFSQGLPLELRAGPVHAALWLFIRWPGYFIDIRPTATYIESLP